MDKLTIRVFRAIDEPDTCVAFSEGHEKVLKDFGIMQVFDHAANWFTDPNIYVLTAVHEDLGLVGGCRLYLSFSEDEPLPVETSIGKLDPAVREFVHSRSHMGIMEIGGLWNSSCFSGKGLPHILVMVGISLSNQLDVNTVIGVAARYTLRYALRLGLPVITEVGKKGWFDYPKPGFYGILTGSLNATEMRDARSDLRQRILSLRLRPGQRTVEDTGVAELDVQYALQLPGTVIELSDYLAVAEQRAMNTA